jgi:hypothetical protein
LNHKSYATHEIVFDEVKLSNYGNLHHLLTATNLDDVSNDILQLKKIVKEEQDQISILTARIDLFQHVIKDIEEINRQ